MVRCALKIMQHLLQDFLSVCVTILGYALIDFYKVKPIA